MKQIPLQYHNFPIWEVCWKFRDAKVSVYSVKTDVFTIGGKDEAKARKVLDFHHDIGGWRVSKYDEIKLPNDHFKLVENQLIQTPTYVSNEIDVDHEYNTGAFIRLQKINR